MAGIKKSCVFSLPQLATALSSHGLSPAVWVAVTPSTSRCPGLLLLVLASSAGLRGEFASGNVRLQYL